jgi:pimeloyl-ACP methyl ester carboxylesterase
MPYAPLADVNLYYETGGPTDGEPLVLIHGLGAQMIAWYPGFIDLLEKSGFFVVRFDNRDVGLSTKFEEHGENPPYSLHDMAADVIGLMDHLRIATAHIAGQSMGGMVAQKVAIDFRDRVISLCSIYSAPEDGFSTNDEEVWNTRNEAPAADRDGAIAQYISREALSGMEGFDQAWLADFAVQVIDRDYTPVGATRQWNAVAASGSRVAELQKLDIAAAVIHGRNDRLISFEGGIATAQAIKDSELHVFPGMGHQVAPRYWDDIVRIMNRNAERGRGRGGSQA